MCSRAFWTAFPCGSTTAFFGVMMILAFMSRRAAPANVRSDVGERCRWTLVFFDLPRRDTASWNPPERGLPPSRRAKAPLRRDVSRHLPLPALSARRCNRVGATARGAGRGIKGTAFELSKFRWTWSAKFIPLPAHLRVPRGSGLKSALLNSTAAGIKGERGCPFYATLHKCAVERPRNAGYTCSMKLFYALAVWRSEERRVGKECRSRWSP